MASPSDLASQIEQAIDGATAELTDAQLTEIGQLAVDMIVLRTKKGLDADRAPFAAYSPDYAEERKKAGLSTTPDLARTGHMLGAIVPQPEPGQVALRFLSPLEEKIATFQNDGTNPRRASSSVRAHSRSAFVDVLTGRRVSRKEAAKDSRRKNKRVAKRVENVSAHSRVGGNPARNFFDVRHPDEVQVISEAIDGKLQGNVEKVS